MYRKEIKERLEEIASIFNKIDFDISILLFLDNKFISTIRPTKLQWEVRDVSPKENRKPTEDYFYILQASVLSGDSGEIFFVRYLIASELNKPYLTVDDAYGKHVHEFTKRIFSPPMDFKGKWEQWKWLEKIVLAYRINYALN